jgi:hypothetical protein
VNENEWTDYFLLTYSHVADEVNSKECNTIIPLRFGVVNSLVPCLAAGYHWSYPSVTKIACLTRPLFPDARSRELTTATYSRPVLGDAS